MSQLPIKTLSTQDEDTIETVNVFKDRKGYGTWSEALEKLVQRAKEAGLHLADAPRQKQPAQSN